MIDSQQSRAEKMGIVDELFKTKEEMQKAGLEFAQKLCLKKSRHTVYVQGGPEEDRICRFENRDGYGNGSHSRSSTAPKAPRKAEQWRGIRKYIEKYSEKRPL